MIDVKDMPWDVYGIIDPRSKKVFYVGMSYIVHDRLGNHCTVKGTTTYAKCREIIEAGHKPSYCIFGTFLDADEAAALEAALIDTLPGLLNRTSKSSRGRPRVGEGRPMPRAPWVEAGISKSTWYRDIRRQAEQRARSQ